MKMQKKLFVCGGKKKYETELQSSQDILDDSIELQPKTDSIDYILYHF